MQKHVFFASLVLLLSGCVSVPESVQLPESTPLVSYQQVSIEPQSQKEKMARWGGVIANIENKADKTQLDIVYYPLRAYGRPVVGKESVGRFRVYVEGFLDPMVYQKGRSITFTGEFAGIEEGLVGEHVYKYPTLQAKGYHLWKDIDRIEIETISVWPMFRYGYPYGYHGWRGWPHVQRHVITRRHNHHRNSGDSNNAVNHKSAGNNSGASTETRSENTVRPTPNQKGKEVP